MASIRWKRSDYLKLGKAVSEFNKEVRRLQDLYNDVFIPEEISYQEAKLSIMSRKELNRVISSLKAIKKEELQGIYELESGIRITKWERAELGKMQAKRTRELKRELKDIKTTPITKEGFTRYQMGSERGRSIEKMLKTKNIEMLEKARDITRFQELRERIRRLGSYDYLHKKSIQYFENYKQVLMRYSQYDNYDKLMELINRLSPEQFFDKVKDNSNLVDLMYQSDQYYTQQEFNSFVQDLGVENLIDSESIDNL